MLGAALHGRVVPTPAAAGHAPLTVLSDSLLQPALPLLRSLLHAALHSERNVAVLLVSAEQAPHRLLPARGTYNPDRVRILDAGAPPRRYTAPVPAPPRDYCAAAYIRIDLGAGGGVTDGEDAQDDLVELLRSAIRDARAAAAPVAGGGVLVVLDSINALVDGLEGGVHQALRVVKAGLQALRGCNDSQFVLVHHDDFPSCPSTSTVAYSPLAAPPALLPALLAPTLSPSTLHVALRPPAHLRYLAVHYAVPLPIASSSHLLNSDPDPDPRTHGLLRALAARAVGDPLVRPQGADDEDERIPLGSPTTTSGSGSGSDSRNRYLVEWSARGVVSVLVSVVKEGGSGHAGAAAQQQERAKARERAQSGRAARTVTWGMCGAVEQEVASAVTTKGGGRQWVVRQVRVADVVEPVVLRNVEESWSATPPTPNPLQSTPIDPSAQPHSHHHPSSNISHRPPGPAPAPAPAPPALTFSLSHTLTPAQLAARAAVPNPFAQADLPIYGQPGYVAPVLPGAAAGETRAGGGGAIEYTPDRADDWDEEDPDGDLEL